MFSIHWERLGYVPGQKNLLEIQVTLLDEKGTARKVVRHHRDWIGVCTDDIEKVTGAIQEHFPGHTVSHVPCGRVKKILPYFEDRLAKGKCDYRQKPFYKVYTSAPHQDVGRFFGRYKIGYYDKDDWLVRIYIDLCTKFNTFEFYYKWYRVTQRQSSLLLSESFEMLPDRTDLPDWTIAAFDLETVPLEGKHIPMGLVSTDRIVMISVYKWNARRGVQTYVLYVLPDGVEEGIPEYPHAYRRESDMLKDFHALIQDAQILTGYNINAFDFPCLFARLVWLKMDRILSLYSSKTIGTSVVTTFQNKIVLDLYSYFQTFSGYDLPSFKLDDVARVKLDGDHKVPVKSVGIWGWYLRPPSKEVFLSRDVEECFRHVRPSSCHDSSEFGTYRTYLDYCLRDSELVYRLFEKEMVLPFLVARANFTTLNAVEALHLGNSHYLLTLFKTYGTRLGYYFNSNHFAGDFQKYRFVLDERQTYQGALNYCVPERKYRDVVVMDFASMYPSALLSSNLCYGTCTIMTRDAWLESPTAQRLTTIPYRNHSYRDFEEEPPPPPTPTPTETTTSSFFSYPSFDPARDEYAIVVNSESRGFLPTIVDHFIKLRQTHQREWENTRDVYHYNVQLGIKILINSLYGVMANKESDLAYLPIAVIIVTLARYQLLASYHFMKRKGYVVCYADTDSLMVQGWPEDDCDVVNRFLNIPHVQLKFEQRMKRLLVLSKKRYVYQTQNDRIVTKGFQKKINGLIKFMSDTILERVWRALLKDEAEEEGPSPSEGWILWTEVLSEVHYMCRDPRKYSIYRKIKPKEEYKSKSCASYGYLERYPERINEYVEMTYGKADVSSRKCLKNVLDVRDCQRVNVPQLFMSQKKIFCTLLKMTYWKDLEDPTKYCDMVLNTILWGTYVRAELKHFFHTVKVEEGRIKVKSGKRITMLVESGIPYNFCINDHIRSEKKVGRRRKLEQQ